MSDDQYDGGNADNSAGDNWKAANPGKDKILWSCWAVLDSLFLSSNN